jgi:hypothetical protein
MRQILAPDTQQVDALPAGDLHRGHLVFLGGVGDGAQLAGLVIPPHMRGTTEKVPSFWMLACLRSLTKRLCGSSLVFQRPVGQQVEVDRRAADVAAVARLPSQFLPDGLLDLSAWT